MLTPRRLRACALAGGIGYTLIAPATVQVFGAPQGPITRSWRMYKLVGLGLCEARYHERRPDGSTLPLDRFELLGIDRATARRDFTHLEGRRRVLQVADQLCERLPGADVRVEARCATLDGWAPEITAEEPLCGRRKR